MNTIIKNNKELTFICSWVDKNDNSKDSKNKKFPVPYENKNKWIYSDEFINKLKILEEILKKSEKYLKFENKKKCLLCDESYGYGTYKLNKYIWEDNLTHYIKIHNIKPPEEFIDFIYFSRYNNILKLESRIIIDNDKKFIKINRNQLLILDALLEHGGYSKKYVDLKNKNIFRYSEHSGLFDFNLNKLQKIVVLGNTNRVDKGDNEIFMPNNVKDMFEYEYIFHTHPPTPSPGGRAKDGVLYELPSIGDILHFIDHFNDGRISGSVVITSEGIYNIRNKNLENKKIIIDEDALFFEYNKISQKIQRDGIKKFGVKFTTEIFYSKIAQDIKLINKINDITNKFNIQIDYIPRINDEKNNWINDTLYLPIYK
jgi:hypothetical protein